VSEAVVFAMSDKNKGRRARIGGEITKD
jgi:hypothetical protein